MKQYANVLENILKYGTIKPSSREGLPATISLFDCSIEILDGSVPILRGKEVKTKNVISELCWFLKGKTNIKYLHEFNNHIWDDDCYRYYREQGGSISFEDWMEEISNGNHKYGDCGRIYGHQWRYQGIGNIMDSGYNQINREPVDQIKNLIDGLINQPYSRYHIVDTWNAQDKEENLQALPACHNFFQCNVRPRDTYNKVLDLSIWQRSCDMFLGVPYNLLSYGILHELLCRITGYDKGNFKWHGGDCHIYENQLDAVNKYFKNVDSIPVASSQTAKIIIGTRPFRDIKEDIDIIDNLDPSDIIITDYKHMGFISAPLNTGVNKWRK